MAAPQKPGDHPEFFRFPAPEGRSRESSIVLDARGRFWHDGVRIENSSMNQAFARWLRRHPEDGRYVLSNDYDWTYIRVEDAPFTVVTLRTPPGEHPSVVLTDGSEEALDLESLRLGAHNAIYCHVKDGEWEARFSPSAQTALAPLLVESEGQVALSFGGRRFSIGLRGPSH